uniref:Uncharacterized protein n=1 Tax=Ditylenchus dipsaci TaxID=166011 RepID=A0A915CXF6_9BILA
MEVGDEEESVDEEPAAPVVVKVVPAQVNEDRFRRMAFCSFVVDRYSLWSFHLPSLIGCCDRSTSKERNKKDKQRQPPSNMQRWTYQKPSLRPLETQKLIL